MKHIIVPLAGGALALASAPARADELERLAASFGVHVEVSFGGAEPPVGYGIDLRGSYLIDAQDFCVARPEGGVGAFAMATWSSGGAARYTLGVHGGRELETDEPFPSWDLELGWSWRTAYDGHPAGSGVMLGVGTHLMYILQASGRMYLSFLDEVVLEGGAGGGLRFLGPFGNPGGSSCDIGRPLRVAGSKTLPAIVAARSRANDPTRRAIAAAWLADARGEAASVPVFRMLARDLAQLGAPSTLVRRALRSAADEVRHTEMCRAIAATHDLTFALARPPAPAPTQTVAALAVDAWHDGCLAEGAAAERAHRAATTAANPLVRTTQAAIAGDEARHAELAWDTMRFALSAGGRSVRDAVARAVAESVEIAPSDAHPDVDPDLWNAHGRLDPATSDRAWHDNRERAKRRVTALLARELRR